MKRLTAHPIVEVLDDNPEWADQFCRIRDKIWPSVSDFASAIEHVGSTSVPGLAAKPFIDMDIVVPSRGDVPKAVIRLGQLGYQHRGNLGIEDREAFWTPPGEVAHHLYVCPQESMSLRNHLALRDHLRSHPSDVATYSVLKKQLAEKFRHDIDRYVEGKTEFILSILAQYGFSESELASIHKANQIH